MYTSTIRIESTGRWPGSPKPLIESILCENGAMSSYGHSELV
jgi:hypothetical protein